MTYRKDSDVVVPYGQIRRKTNKKVKNKVPYVTQNELEAREMAIMMASHCKTPSNRQKLIEELRKHIPVVIYGQCGSLRCGSQSLVQAVAGHNPNLGRCPKLIKTYAFYLAFENTLCTEYVTEKLYRTLKIGGIIPVVYGGADYSTFAPPHSYIDSKEFETPFQLANFMKTVAVNATLYNTYLKWMEDYEVEVGSPYKPFVCDLCKRLHARNPLSPPKYYEDILKWLTETNVKCFNYENIFKNESKNIS